MALPEFATLPLAGDSYALAMAAATISILLGGILLGAGIALRSSRVRLFGQEEIAQGIVSAIMVGGIVAFAALLNTAASSMAQASPPRNCPGSQNITGSPFGYYECGLEEVALSYSRLSSALLQSSVITGFASSLKISAGTVSAQPFFALEEASRSLFSQSSGANSIQSMAHSQRLLADAARSSSLLIFLPIGILLRSFFATRKLGAAAIALAVSVHMVYPMLFLYTFAHSTASPAAGQAAAAAESFNSQFASLPLLELDDTGGVKRAMDGMSEGDFGGKLQPILSSAAIANSLSYADLAIFPIVSLIVTGVAALELYRLFSAQIFLLYFSEI